MAIKALVIGGTRYFGVDLVNHLIAQGVEVTVATLRGSDAPFEGEVERALVDRKDPESLVALAASGTWDVLYDQLCASSVEAESLLRAFQGSLGRLVLTSSIVVYSPHAPGLKESDYDPAAEPLEIRTAPNYAQGKRDAEAAYAQLAKIPVAMARLPMVLGHRDPDARLVAHVRKVRAQEPFFCPNMATRVSFILREQAGRFVADLGLQEVSGPLNGGSPEPISVAELMATLERTLEKPVLLAPDAQGGERSRFAWEQDCFLDVGRAKSLGFEFSPVAEYLPRLIREIDEQLAPA
jgi:nucleoside-diphosphate-sugar epimerase